MRPFDFMRFDGTMAIAKDWPVKVFQGDKVFIIESYTIENNRAVLRLKEDGFNPNPANWAPRKTRNLVAENAI